MKPPTGKDVALIPAHNEERTITEVVTKINAAGIVPVVIDDASTDKTAELAEKSGATVLRHSKNLGKGEAIKTGLNFAFKRMTGVQNFVFIDADMQYDPAEAAALLKPLKQRDADLVVGFRDWSIVPFRHRLGNFVWRTAFNFMFGTKMKDTNCGFVAMNRQAALAVKDIAQGGYILENAMLARVVESGLRVHQVPVTVSYRQVSGVGRGMRVGGGVLLFILKSGLKHRLGRIINRKKS
ncbi:MAG: glycosyltransferase family 2 protein [Candidatus Aenigmarchaeota archaeon]|nr:glycosyltransferase family 2 protein [Candidatus Aenigmarchaeota archaeon]